FWRPRLYVERMDIASERSLERRQHEAMTLDAALAAERFGHESHPKVPAFARTRVPGVLRAIVHDVELQRRELALERLADAANAFGSHVPETIMSTSTAR